MRRADFERTLRQMEHIREMSYEAETPAEEKRLIAEYGVLSRAIRPYTTGKAKLED